jgi:HTH-type transcriptional regulator/antitoxin HigA
MQIKPIRSEEEHTAALAEIERLWGAPEGSPEGDHLEVIATLVEAFERKHFPIDVPDPIEVIRFRLEQQGEPTKSLIGVIGSRTRVYEVMRGDRPLSLEMIRRLNQHLQIPADVLIQRGRKNKRKVAA